MSLHIDYSPCSFEEFMAEAEFMWETSLYLSLCQDGVSQIFEVRLHPEYTRNPIICLYSGFNQTICLDTSRGTLSSSAWRDGEKTIRTFKFRGRKNQLGAAFSNSLQLM